MEHPIGHSIIDVSVFFLFHVLQDIEQMIPYHLYGRDVQALVRSVYVAQSRTE